MGSDTNTISRYYSQEHLLDMLILAYRIPEKYRNMDISLYDEIIIQK